MYRYNLYGTLHKHEHERIPIYNHHYRHHYHQSSIINLWTFIYHETGGKSITSMYNKRLQTITRILLLAALDCGGTVRNDGGCPVDVEGGV